MAPRLSGTRPKAPWGNMSARVLLSDTRTDELTASEFETDLVVAGIDPSTLEALLKEDT